MSPDSGSGKSEVAALLSRSLDRVEVLCAELRAVTARFQAEQAQLHPAYRESGPNLLRYLALRHHDIRGLQKDLASLGLSSLGRSEAHVLATMEGVLNALHALAQRPWQGPLLDDLVAAFHLGKQLLEEHTAALLGPRPRERFVRIMVTLPSAAAEAEDLVPDLLKAGMNCARINCAHDDPAVWRRMAERVRRASSELGAPCQILMDLAGPKLRTGALEPGPAVVRIRPSRDARGAVITPARIWLGPAPLPQTKPEPMLPFPTAWLADLAVGEVLRLRDLRGKRREWRIVERVGAALWAEADEACYVESGTLVKAASGSAAIGQLPPLEAALLLRPGDLLLLTRDSAPGHGGRPDGTPAQVPITLPEVIAMVRPGESIWFDDGHIGGVIEAVAATHLAVRIRQAAPSGSKLGADKGVNLPESDLTIRGFTDQDHMALPHAAALADMVGLSFVSTPDDIEAIRAALASLGSHAGLVLKIETCRGFARLPQLLLAAMRGYPVGVMIARGDLAVECGFERLAEVQEEMLCICEAAQVPVIWATQVLESLTKTGQPTRAEVTDAAASVRAECVMLNKGPFICEAVCALDDVIRRMQSHQSKRTPKLRALHLADFLG